MCKVTKKQRDKGALRRIFSEGDVHAHAQRGVAAQRDHLFADLADEVVHAEEDVETLGMDIDDPSHAGGERVGGQVHAAVEPVEWFPVGTEAAFCPGVLTAEACGAEQSEVYLLIAGQCIAHADVHPRGEHGGAATLVAFVL